MKLNTIKRITLEDFDPKEQPLMSKLLYPLNTFMETIVNAMTSRLNFQDNFAAQVKDLEVTAPVAPATPISFKSTLASPCRGIFVVNVENLTNPAATLSAAPFCSFTNTGSGQIQITNITGLNSGDKYRVKLICLE
jgi:hypothetical protein